VRLFKVPRHEIGQSELFTPFKDILLVHSKGTACAQKFFIWTPLLFFLELKVMLAHTEYALAHNFFAS